MVGCVAVYWVEKMVVTKVDSRADRIDEKTARDRAV